MRRQQRINAALQQQKVCECGHVSATVFAGKQHKRRCRFAVKAGPVLPEAKMREMLAQLGFPRGTFIHRRGHSKLRHPEPAGKCRWIEFRAWCGRVLVTVHPKTGNVCFCPKTHPGKFETERFFGYYHRNNGRQMSNGSEFFKDGKDNTPKTVVNKWGAAVEIVVE